MTERIATLSFDDGGWQDEYVTKCLNDLGVPATFYLCAGYLDRFHYHDLADRIPSVYEGHEIGSHSLTHADFQKVDAAQAFRECTEARHILRHYFHQPIDCFCWPYGVVSRIGFTALRDAGYRYGRTVALWQTKQNVIAPEYQIAVSHRIPLDIPTEELLTHPYVHLFGHGYEIRDSRRAKDISGYVQFLLGHGYRFVVNSVAFDYQFKGKDAQ